MDCFARLVHWLDIFLKTCRGDDGAKVAVGIYEYAYAASHRHPADPGDIGVGLTSACADADRARLERAPVAYINVVTTAGNARPCVQADGDVIRASHETPNT